MVGDLIINLVVRIDMTWSIFIALGCILIGGRHFMKGLNANEEIPKQTKWFQIIFGIFMILLGIINLLKII